MNGACVLVLAALSVADGGQEFRQELLWVVPPGWVVVQLPSANVAAHDPKDPTAVVVVLHVSTGRRIDVDFLRKALERYPTPGMPLPAAMLGTCSDGQLRFACEELQSVSRTTGSTSRMPGSTNDAGGASMRGTPCRRVGRSRCSRLSGVSLAGRERGSSASDGPLAQSRPSTRCSSASAEVSLLGAGARGRASSRTAAAAARAYIFSVRRLPLSPRRNPSVCASRCGSVADFR